jgi:hypothetical protein
MDLQRGTLRQRRIMLTGHRLEQGFQPPAIAGNLDRSITLQLLLAGVRSHREAVVNLKREPTSCRRLRSSRRTPVNGARASRIAGHALVTAAGVWALFYRLSYLSVMLKTWTRGARDAYRPRLNGDGRYPPGRIWPDYSQHLAAKGRGHSNQWASPSSCRRDNAAVHRSCGGGCF